MDLTRERCPSRSRLKRRGGSGSGPDARSVAVSTPNPRPKQHLTKRRERRRLRPPSDTRRPGNIVTEPECQRSNEPYRSPEWRRDLPRAWGAAARHPHDCGSRSERPAASLLPCLPAYRRARCSRFARALRGTDAHPATSAAAVFPMWRTTAGDSASVG
jgi:hypothetical protein